MRLDLAYFDRQEMLCNPVGIKQAARIYRDADHITPLTPFGQFLASIGIACLILLAALLVGVA